MKIIVTHKSPDMDGITSCWLIKKFLPGWENAKIKFVIAGEKLFGMSAGGEDIIEKVNGDEIIHVDTGLGKLDHHQIQNNQVSAASLTYDYVLKFGVLSTHEIKKEALKRIVEVVVDDDHFQEVFCPKPESYYYDFSLFAILDGLKLQHPGEDDKIVEFAVESLDALLHMFENRVWAEKELEEKGVEFKTIWGKAIALETLNDYTLELGQKRGYVLVVRKDPNTGFVRIKARPARRAGISNSQMEDSKLKGEDISIDLTEVYKKLKNRDQYATWYLHISKRMLLNGSSKNPTAVGTKLSLEQIIKVFEEIK